MQNNDGAHGGSRRGDAGSIGGKNIMYYWMDKESNSHIDISFDELFVC